VTAIVDQPFPITPDGLLVALTKDNRPFWSALESGYLALQACLECRAYRYPIAPVCPRCGGLSCEWRKTCGRGVVFSFVRYRRSFLPEFEPRLPYVVATVALDEGPRMFGLLRGRHEPPCIGEPVRLEIERWPGGRCIPAFRCLSGEDQ
jgi:uncharacterized OB-fold protein